MYCYKCASSEHLSVKKTNRNGTKYYICKPCRNADYKKRQKVPVIDWNRNWNSLAAEINGRVIEKYAKNSSLTNC